MWYASSISAAHPLQFGLVANANVKLRLSFAEMVLGNHDVRPGFINIFIRRSVMGLKDVDNNLKIQQHASRIIETTPLV